VSLALPLPSAYDAPDQETPLAALVGAAAFIPLMKYTGPYTTCALLSAGGYGGVDPQRAHCV
jgi:hypothetical protein